MTRRSPGSTVDRRHERHAASSSINGTPTTLTLAHGTYTGSQLAQAVQAAATSAGAPITASLDRRGHALARRRPARERRRRCRSPAATRSARSSLSTDGAAHTGTDGVLQVDGGANQTFSSLDVGPEHHAQRGRGNDHRGARGRAARPARVTGNNVSTGDGSLATVVGNINAAGAGVTATAVQVGLNTYRLQLTSNTAGANNGENIDASAFNDNVGGFLTLTNGRRRAGHGRQRARLVHGHVEHATRSAACCPGVTVNLKQQSASPVTVTVNRDDAGIADKVQALDRRREQRAEHASTG